MRKETLKDDPPLAQRAEQVALVIDACIERRLSGEACSDAQVIAEHPELMPELAEELAHLALIQRARHVVPVMTVSSDALRLDGHGIEPPPDQAATVQAEDSAAAGLPSDSFTGYQLLREIHRGGQGVVYQAIQKSTRRKVAIKVMREGPFAGPGDLARFQREVQVLGQLQHPNIVAIHDSGSAIGHFYFVMDYISGQPLDTYMAGARHSVRDTLKLFATICEAVNAAHLRGIIHRDLKPGNIRIDESGQPHVLDFGLAKVALGGLTGQETGPTGVMTMTGQFVGSVPWASPEQAEGSPSKIDLRTDVYSLGVILYQMLTGKFPYEVIGPMRDVLDRIIRAEPVRPRTVRKQIDDEVETITLKCLQKERERRYQTAGELARDVRHYLAGEPIEAKRDSAWYHFRKMIWRYRVATSVALAFMLLAAGSSIALAILYGKQSYQRQRAETALQSEQRQRRNADRVSEFMSNMLDGAAPWVALGNDTTLLKTMMDASAQRIKGGELGDSPEAELRLRRQIADVYGALGKYSDAEALLAPAMTLAQSAFGPEHAEVAATLLAQVEMLYDRADFSSGLTQAQAALAMLQRLYSGDREDVATGMNNLGACLEQLGRPAEALPHHQAALAMRRRLHPGPNLRTARSLSHIAACLDGMGSTLEALAMHDEALVMSRALYHGDHPNVAESLANVALVLNELARPAEALPKFEESQAMRRRLFTGDHPDLANSLHNIAACLSALGREAEALQMSQEALEMCQRLYAGDHPHVAFCLNNVAKCLENLDRADEALHKYQASLDMLGRLFPGDHPAVATLSGNVAFCLQKMDRAAEALPVHEAALAMRKRLFPGDHPDVALGLHNVAGCLEAMGRPADALPICTEALAMRRRVRPAEHPDITGSEMALGGVLVALGKYSEAQELLLVAVERMERRQDAPRRATQRAVERMLKLYDAWDAAEPGQGYAEKAAEWRAKLENAESVP